MNKRNIRKNLVRDKKTWEVNWRRPRIKERKLTKFFWLVRGKKNLKLGKYTDIGPFVYLDAENGLIIEDNVQIGSHCAIYTTSTIDNKKGSVVLKKNCSIGSHSTVMPGVTVGENSIVGAHSLVNKDIPDNVVAFGCPAKVVRRVDNAG